MDVNRVEAIIQADDKINVTLNGENVWIDSVDSEAQTAVVHAENRPAEVKTVSVEELKEV